MRFIKKVLSVVLCLISVLTTVYFTSSASDENDFVFSTLADGTIKIIKYNGNEEEIVIPEMINGLIVSELGDGVFQNKKKITKIILPDTVTTIGNNAFYSCLELKDIKLSNNVEIIGNNVFSNCNKLSMIDIPASIKKIGISAFSNCISLNAINVSSNNIYYSSENGVLFNKDKSVLMNYPAGKDLSAYKIPNTVISLADNSFAKCLNLHEIEFSRNLEVVSSGTFTACENLKSVIIYNKLNSIGNLAFDSCTSLSSVFYYGNTNEWNSINFDDDKNEELLNKIVVCKDNDRNYTIKLSQETELSYSSKIPFELKVSDKNIIRVDGIAIKNNAGQYEVTAKITPLKSGECTISAVAENGFVLCNFNYTVEKCSHSMVFFKTLEAETCTEDGRQLFKCEYCDYSKEEIVKSTGHSMGEWKVEVKATKDKEGLEVRVCNNYNCDYKEEKIIPKLPSSTESNNTTGNTSTRYSLGDVDGNGKVNATDARKILRHVAGLDDLNNLGLKAADIDGNKKINATDARKVLRHVAGLEYL